MSKSRPASLLTLDSSWSMAKSSSIFHRNSDAVSSSRPMTSKKLVIQSPTGRSVIRFWGDSMTSTLRFLGGGSVICAGLVKVASVCRTDARRELRKK